VNFEESKSLLASVAVLDNRTVDATSITMWEAVLAPFTFAECMWALREFARNNVTDYLRPAHLVDIIRRKRAQYADMNPGRSVGQADAWLVFEAQIAAALTQIKAHRGNARLAVEAMEDDDGGEGDRGTQD